ncbi:PREDICTED: uncharacterized protein At3g49140-like isoform X1 [Populus euphratica]|uniref:Uncharacterized protein At3g49140-like isoform X1 n=2 Tax=Populus euphratica TaxID=75702 RepID=A0AAJ6Y8C6_POPEU|nr:PREDICTED: uncharacterized protein At3g49140-like isoform X1 [Populus euphratica]
MVMAMAMMIETTTAVRFPPSTTPAANFFSSLPRSSPVILWNKFRRLNDVSFLRRSSHLKSKIQASAENLDSNLDSSKQNGKLQYHPSEGIAESTSETSSDAMLTPQETFCRANVACSMLCQAKSKATLMLTGVINDDIHENIIWPDLPYVTDEHGNIYLQVKNDEDILQTLTTENNFVQAIIGFDATEMLSEMESLGTSEIDFGVEEIEEEDSDVEDGVNEDDDDYDEDLVAVLNDDDEEDDDDEALGDWAKLETMSSSHPMYFAKKLAQVASDDPIDWMEQPPAGVAIQGLIRPAFMEEQSDIQRHMSGNQSHHAGTNQVGQSIEGKLEEPGVINGHEHNSGSSEDISLWREELEKDEVPSSGASFYKLEMIKIQLISAHGHQTTVEVEDFRKAQPDAIALSAAKIISRLKAGGEKIMQAFKSLCWRCKGIQVEEAMIIDVDSLGFDLRVCSGTQIQTLRFAFNSRATSEYSAERQLNDLLFPRIQSRLQKKNIAQMP